MEQKHIDVTRCVDCGCDRGGVVDLSAETPVLRCFQCNKAREEQNVGRKRKQ